MPTDSKAKRPNQAVQRTPGFGVQLPSAAAVRPAQSRVALPAMKPGTARAFALRRRAHSRAPSPESLSLGSLGVAHTYQPHNHTHIQPTHHNTPHYKSTTMKTILTLAFCLFVASGSV